MPKSNKSKTTTASYQTKRRMMTTMTTTNQPIIDLNNWAVAGMQQGYYDHAIENLTIAVVLLLRESKPVVTCPCHSILAQQHQRSLAFHRNRKQLHRVRIRAETATASQETQITLGSMYCGAFLLSHQMYSNNNVTSSPFDGHYNLAVAVVLYNLALVNHWRGIHYGDKSGLLKALRLYESVLTVIQQQPHGTDMYHMTLAATQNMGHIHIHLMHREEAMACFECLRRLLSNEYQVLPEEDFAMFFVSAMFQEHELHLAPAA